MIIAALSWQDSPPDSSQNVTAVKYSHHRMEEPWPVSWDEVSGDLICDLFME
jgi:hypothetical protein